MVTSVAGKASPAPAFMPGLVHVPVTPFKSNLEVDFETYGRILDFHLRNGAEALAIPMHAGESVSLTDAEQRDLLQFAIKRIEGRVPLIAHVSDSGTAVAVERARHAERLGAAGIVLATPYYWTPPPAMVLEHFGRVGTSVSLPLLMHYAPHEMSDGRGITSDLVLRLSDRLGNFVGVVDESLDWQFMVTVLSNARKHKEAFQLISGNEYLVSAAALGAKAMFSALSAVAPKLIRALYDACRAEKYFEARAAQEAVAELRQALKSLGIGGIKAAVRAMGRDCGVPRPPLESPSSGAFQSLERALRRLDVLKDEPRGW